MKKTKILALMALATFGATSFSYADDAGGVNLSPEGYWVQFDEDPDAGRGMPQGIIHTYFADNNDYGKKGTLQMEIVVPLMYVDASGKPTKPRATCNNCSNGSYNGFDYKGKNTPLQGIVFAGNMQPQSGTGVAGQSSDIYKDGGVINPNDGKVYASEAQVQDKGRTMYAKAAYIVWGKELGSKAAHWQRITKADYEKVKADCGVTADGQYVNKDEKVTATCTNYPVEQFGVKSPV
ncbi:DUF2147 domain-containing protein [Francisella philomiragia]|uniref:DUF2147 domain-containing protein n=1 Tax=Francisella philomiragia TaxID=28110 RepID=A0A0B6D8L0_9GAMM|nr:DUF2147 domain-containing protein [Francisella philomiragia]AJI53943.1 hypothetical protein LA55_583 [Francisella philomiragia]MBY7735145.1 DUF2147 domain-containing protein [Francisella philomiragia]